MNKIGLDDVADIFQVIDRCHKPDQFSGLFLGQRISTDITQVGDNVSVQDIHLVIDHGDVFECLQIAGYDRGQD